MTALSPRLPPSSKRLRLHAWLWGAIEVTALWRARWRRRGEQAEA